MWRKWLEARYTNFASQGPINILLVFVPIGIFAGAHEWDPTTVFTLNFFAIIPLAAVLSFATEEISVRLGDTMGGLLNATFGNAVELIVRLPVLVQLVLHLIDSLPHRLASSHSRRAKSRLCSPRCWAPSSRTYCLSWACAFY